MNSNPTLLVLDAYEALGIDPSRGADIAADANDALEIARDPEKIGSAAIAVCVIKMAQSRYFEAQPRIPTLLAAAEGGAFYPDTHRFIIRSPFCAQIETDIRDTKDITKQLWNKFLCVSNETVTKKNVPGKKSMLAALREVACLSAICRELPKSSFDTDRDPKFGQSLNDFLREVRRKAATPKAKL